MRGSAVRIGNAEGVPEGQLHYAELGIWEKGSMSTAYLSRLPRECMRVLAGFLRCPGNYYLWRTAVKPPTALKRKAWPWVIDSWYGIMLVLCRVAPLLMAVLMTAI